MKNLFLIICLILCSCETEHSQPDCCAAPPPVHDNIKLSSEELWFNASGGIDSRSLKRSIVQRNPIENDKRGCNILP